MFALVRAPLAVLLIALTLAFGSAALVVMALLDQPWLGIDIRQGGRIVTAVEGPAAALPPGSTLLSLRSPEGGAALVLDDFDTVEEPDTLPDRATMDRVFSHAQTARDLAMGPLLLDYLQPGATQPQRLRLDPAPRRPLGDLPLTLWTQLGVGLVAMLFGGLILGLKRREPAARLVALSGLGMMVSAHAAALYSSRELALPETVFTAASRLNGYGALLFGAAAVWLFLIYPRRLGPRGLGPLLAALILSWGVLVALGLIRDPLLMAPLPIALTILLLTGIIVLQYRASWRDPLARAALRWFSLGFAVSSGAFLLAFCLPVLLRQPLPMPQAHAFLFFLLIYLGMGFSVLRYRLFEVQDWSVRILYYVLAAVLLLAVDALLIYALAVERVAALSLSFFVVTLTYLPLREWLMTRVFGPPRPDPSGLFARVTELALSDPGPVRTARMQGLMRWMFDPMRVEPLAEMPTEPRIDGDGTALCLPALPGVAPLRLVWARQGRALFSPRDLETLRSVLGMAAQSIERRDAFERGIAQERARITRDMHDNIGVQLMGALHAPETARKDALIRRTLSELREIVTDPFMADAPLEALLGDLRAELSGIVAARGLRFDWCCDEAVYDALASKRVAHALRALLRETVNNALRHARADAVVVDLRLRDGALWVRVADDGIGALPEDEGAGNGLSGLRARLEAAGGEFRFGPGPQGRGTVLEAGLPLRTAGSGPGQKEEAA
ncbi:sensor histidine kinase [Salipiger marinus]|uniref:histidine kinase n=1 Tax=Salipiger marinus TaxID=555512 RepID=A0A1G8JV26_9RHOB|nr:ATP-binding protein [Salipiger marinus]SDI35008.1 hypothetical protein SAMN04487993_1003275 [Salipiger marinus]